MIPLISPTLARKWAAVRASIGRPQRDDLYARLGFVVATSALLGGCALRGAPSFTLFGAFFPGWMFCAAIGLLGAVGARVAFVATGLANILPFQLFVCAAIGLCLALLAWLIWFGR